MKRPLATMRRGFLLSLVCLCGLDAGISFSNRTSTVNVGNARLTVNTPITGWNGTLQQTGGLSGQPITFNAGILERNGTPAFLTAQYTGTNTQPIFLRQNHSIRIEPGTFVPSISILRNGNRIEGAPIFSSTSSVNLAHRLSAVTLALNGKLDSNIVMNNGTVTLDNDLGMADDRLVTGSGIVNLNGYRFSFGGRDLSLTHSIYWQNAAEIVLYGKLSLSGTWTIAGAGPNNQARIIGNGNTLDLTNRGTIWVKAGTRLCLNDLKIKGLGRGGFVFEDKTAQLCIGLVEIEMANSYTFTNGGIYVDGTSTIVTKNKTLTFSQRSSVTVDGVSLWYDTLTLPDSSNIQPLITAGSNSASQYVVYLNDGVIRSYDSSSSTIIKNISNSVIKNTKDIKNISNALLYCCKNLSNSLLYGLKNISNATIKNKNDIKNISNALLYCCKNLSNSLLYLTKNLSNSVVFNIKNVSNATIKNKNDIKNNSNAIIKLVTDVKNTSNSIVKNTVDIRVNSNALLYCCKNLSNSLLYLTKNLSNSVVFNIKNVSNATIKNKNDIKNNSNAIIKLVTDVKNTSNSIVKNTVDIRVNSNALLYCCKNLSNSLLYLTKNLSNALIKTTVDIRVNSNAILYCCKNLSNSLLYLTKNLSNSVVFNIKNVSNATIKNKNDIKNNSNAIIKLVTDVKNTSNSIVKNTVDIRVNSNALLYCCKNLSNSLLYLTKNLSNSVVFNIKNVSNATIKNKNDIKNNSNAILYWCKNGSNSILYLTKNLSNSLLYLTKNNSTAIVNLAKCCKELSNSIIKNTVDIKNISNATIKNKDDIKNNSNAILYCCKNLSNSLLYLTKNLSNSLLYNIKNISNATIKNKNDIKNNSNAILYWCKNGSNSILYLTKNLSNSLLYLTKNNSTAIVNLAKCCKELSNSIIKNTVDIKNISNATIKNKDDIKNNSNAILYCCKNLSNSLLYLTKNLSNSLLYNIKNISNATIKNKVDIKNNSNTILYCCKNNSNAILQNETDPNIYLDAANPFVVTNDYTFNATNHFIHFSNDTNLIQVAAGKTLTLQNVVLKDFSPSHFDCAAGGALLFGAGTEIHLSHNEDNLGPQRLELNCTWSFVGGGKSIIDGAGLELHMNVFNAISVLDTTTLTIQNIKLSGLGYLNPGNVKCVGRNATIAFRNVEIILEHTYTFSNGYLGFYPDVSVNGSGHTFAYTTPKRSMIVDDAILKFDMGTTFSYDSRGASKTRLGMAPTAILYMNGATLVTTRTGLRLDQGMLVVDNRVTFSSQARNNAEAIEMASTLDVQLMSGAVLDLFGRVSVA